MKMQAATVGGYARKGVPLGLPRWFRNNSLPWALLLPALILLVGVVGYPSVDAMWISLHERRMAMPDMPFVGLENYASALNDSAFWRSAGLTVYFTVGAVVLKLALGLAVALVVNERWPLRGLVRVVILIPWALPPITAVLVWRLLMDDNFQVLNFILIRAGILHESVSWLGSLQYAMLSTIWVNVWRGFPFFAICLLAGLQTIPGDLYDAAKADGANMLQRFIYVTVPGIVPVLAVTVALSTIWTFNDFSSIWLLTKGGPGTATTTLPILSYYEGFLTSSRNLSLAAVYAIVAFPLLIGLIAVVTKVMAQREEET